MLIFDVRPNTFGLKPHAVLFRVNFGKISSLCSLAPNIFVHFKVKCTFAMMILVFWRQGFNNIKKIVSFLSDFVYFIFGLRINIIKP